MDIGTVAMVAIGVTASVFVIFAYYWWEVRPAQWDDPEER